MSTKSKDNSSSLGISGSKAGGIEDDFLYGTNVASAHIYVRMGFMRKVYGILCAQLITTTVIAAAFMMMSDSAQLYLRTNTWMMTVALLSTFGLMFALMWKRHETPTNYILLGIFTLVESFTIGVVVTLYKVPSVVNAFVLTVGIFIGLTLYTLQSKRDFSSWHAPATMCLWGLIMTTFIQILFPMPALHLGISLFGALLFCVFIVVDTHLIMSKLSPEEYILASINLYLDVLNLFLYILSLLGERK